MNAPSDTTQRPTLADSFSSLRIPNYRILWWAGLFSFMSVQMQFILRGLLAWDLTEREGALGLVYLFFGVAMLVVTPFGGVVADRIPRRTTLFISQLIIFLGASLMGLAVLTDLIQFWMVLAASLMQGVAFGFYGPARVAFASDLVGRDQLGNAITLSLLSMSGTRIFAPSLAGVLAGVAFIGIGGAYLLSAAFSFLSVVAIWRLPKIEISEPSKRNPISDIVDGVRYTASKPPLRRLVVASFIVIMFGFNYVAFLPALVKDVFELGDDGDAWVGLLSMASAIGAVAVSVPLASRADAPNAKSIMAASGLMFGLAVVVLALTPTLGLAFLTIIFIGGFTTAYQSLSNTLALQMANDMHQGRVQSLMQLSFAGFGIAALPLGILAEAITLRGAMLVMGGVAFGASLVYMALDARDREPTAPAIDATPEPDDLPRASAVSRTR